jgi:hypothetical protein
MFAAVGPLGFSYDSPGPGDEDPALVAKNIDDFDAAVASILGRLYATFPNKTTVDAFELAGDANDATRETYASTVEFLRDEGFLSYGQRSGKRGLFAQVVLTTKGLALLGATPASLSGIQGVEGSDGQRV